jgi:hypothetical protein
LTKSPYEKSSVFVSLHLLQIGVPNIFLGGRYPDISPSVVLCFWIIYLAIPTEIPLYNLVLRKSYMKLEVRDDANMFAIISDLIPDEISLDVFSCFWSAYMWMCQLHGQISP